MFIDSKERRIAGALYAARLNDEVAIRERVAYFAPITRIKRAAWLNCSRLVINDRL